MRCKDTDRLKRRNVLHRVRLELCGPRVLLSLSRRLVRRVGIAIRREAAQTLSKLDVLHRSILGRVQRDELKPVAKPW